MGSANAYSGGFYGPVYSPLVARSHDVRLTSEGPLFAEARRAEVQRLRAAGLAPRPPKTFKFIDLFAGIGGFRLGFEGIDGTCVFSAEINKWAVQTYEANFGTGHGVARDIRPLKARDIPPFDVLTAGFPCQPFSIAGVSKKNALGQPHGFDCDTQGTLFFEVERILAYHKPAAFLLENVKNLLSHDKGRTFEVIRHVLEDKLRYHVSVRVIDASHFVPQHRERVFIAGFRKPSDFNFDDLVLPNVERLRLSSVLHPEDGTEEADGRFTEGPLATVSKKYVLSGHLWRYLWDYAKRHKAEGHGFGFGLVGPDDVARTLSARYFKDGSEILVRRGRGNPRRLTPRECARLMGFDRPGREPFKIPVSDTQAYKQFGNAVVVPVVEYVAGFMAPHIGAAMEIVAAETAKDGSGRSDGRRIHAKKA